jgi:hypothetical protein
MKPRVSSRFRMSPLFDPVLSQINPIHTIIPLTYPFNTFPLTSITPKRTVVTLLTFIGPCIAIYFYSKSNKMQQLLKFILFLG